MATNNQPLSPQGYNLGGEPLNTNPFWEEAEPAPPEYHGIPAGGEPGQVLTKQSYADYDADWQDPTGGGEGGTTNYNQLTNKPSIEGVTLTGDKSLEELGAASAEDMRRMDQDLEGQIAAEQADRQQADTRLEQGISANTEAIEGLREELATIEPGVDGGYYKPSVSDDGELTWKPSKSDMPAVAPANIKGPPGDAAALPGGVTGDIMAFSAGAWRGTSRAQAIADSPAAGDIPVAADAQNVVWTDPAEAVGLSGGTEGQVLTRSGAGYTWRDAAGGGDLPQVILGVTSSAAASVILPTTEVPPKTAVTVRATSSYRGPTVQYGRAILGVYLTVERQQADIGGINYTDHAGSAWGFGTGTYRGWYYDGYISEGLRLIADTAMLNGTSQITLSAILYNPTDEPITFNYRTCSIHVNMAYATVAQSNPADPDAPGEVSIEED